MVKFKKKYLDKSENPYFISEIGINHNGYLSMALEMIKGQKKLVLMQLNFKREMPKIY